MKEFEKELNKLMEKYQVEDIGDDNSDDATVEEELSVLRCPNGYKWIQIVVNGRRKRIRVCR